MQRQTWVHNQPHSSLLYKPRVHSLTDHPHIMVQYESWEGDTHDKDGDPYNPGVYVY